MTPPGDNRPVHPLEFGMNQTLPQYEPEIVAEMNSVVKLPGGAVISEAARSRPVRRGDILARLTADVAGVGLEGQYIVRKATEAAVQADSGSSEITVKDAHGLAVGDTLAFGGTANDAVVTDVDYDNNVVTISGTLSANVAADEAITVETSGQGVPAGIAANGVSFSRLSGMTGRTSVYTEGTFYKNALRGLDAAAEVALGAIDVESSYGTLVRIRVGATGIVA